MVIGLIRSSLNGSGWLEMCPSGRQLKLAVDPDLVWHLVERRGGPVDGRVGGDDAEDLHLAAPRNEPPDELDEDLLHGLECPGEVAAVADADLAEGELDAPLPVDLDGRVVLLARSDLRDDR